MLVVGPMVAQAIVHCGVPTAGMAVTFTDHGAHMEGKLFIWYGTQQTPLLNLTKMTLSPAITVKQNSCGQETGKPNPEMAELGTLTVAWL